ncbi:alanine racemase [Micrococcaceae bacterium Sec5.7]
MLELDPQAVESGRHNDDSGRPALPDGRPSGDWRLAGAAVRALPAPLAVLDRQSLSANAGSLLRRAGGKPIRVASKSIRCRDVLRAVLATEGFSGILAYTLAEGLWLADEFDDVVVAYPTADDAALRLLAADPALLGRVTVMVDSAEQLVWMESVLRDVNAAGRIRLCIDLDVGWRPGGGPHIGVRRSPVRTPEEAADLAAEIARRRGFLLVGLMGYEAHVAGLGDQPLNPARAAAVKAMQSRSMQELTVRRQAAVAAVSRLADLEFVNGGGTGSLELSSRDDSLTELAAGSGLFGPATFDRYSRFRPAPAAAFALPVVRRPAPDTVVVLGGGWIASGPPGRDRLPTPVHPPGLRYLSAEAAGEVQTPLQGSVAATLSIGEKVWFRHAKSGELCEHVDSLLLLDSGEVRGELPTYRGEGKAFL